MKITLTLAASLAGKPPPMIQWYLISSYSAVIRGEMATVFIWTCCLMVLIHFNVSGSQNLHPSVPEVANKE